MNLTSIVRITLAHIATTDFTQAQNGASQEVSGFEATIRYIGGLLSAYDLLTNDYHIDALLAQAVVLADKLKPRFDTPSGLPAETLNFLTNTRVDTIIDSPWNETRSYRSSNTAVCGTIILEYYRLSDLTGDDSYRQIANKVENILLAWEDLGASTLGYLVTPQLDTDTGYFMAGDRGWKSSIDSFYEYLIKASIYDTAAPVSFNHSGFWANAVLDTYKLMVQPHGWPDVNFLTELDVYGNAKHVMDTYACFAGGNILYGMTYFDYRFSSSVASAKEMAFSIIDSCYHVYNTTTAGVSPRQWIWSYETDGAPNTKWAANVTDDDYQVPRGYWMLDSSYDSFPETLESIFYAHRITGQIKYKEWNWQIFQKIRALTKPDRDIVYSGVENVDVYPYIFLETLPSYYFAELLKYLYLTFSEPDLMSLNEWVANTEGHFFRIKDC